jgi:Glycosyltransferases involved in cell wall biogenesis
MTAKYIKDAVDSVIAQTYKNWELIIVDDCSNDNTDIIVNSIEDKRIKYFKRKYNVGAAACRNKAIREARGEWIAFLDSDDRWLPQKLEKQIQFMNKNNCFFSYTEYEEMDENGNLSGVLVSGPYKVSKRGMYNYCWPGCLTVMYNQKKIGLINIPNIRRNNDYALWLKVIEKADCYLLKEKLAYYRRGRKGSISTYNYLGLIYWHYRLFRVSVGQNIIHSVINTVRNLLFGLVKKVIYIRKT